MSRKLILPVIAMLLMGFAVMQVVRAQQKPPKPAPPVEPARTPYAHTVAGAGIVEARSENISIGSQLSGVVTQVFVKVGDQVKAGDPLFRLDDRQLQAQLKSRTADLLAAEAQLSKLEQMPRREEIPPSEAKVREAESNLTDQRDQLDRSRRLYASRAIGQEELVKREQAFETAKQQLARVRAEHDLLLAGAWSPEKEIARAAVAQAKAQVEQVQTDLARLQVTASVEGDILQVNVHPGEFVATPSSRDLVLMGDVHRLHVRVDIDEADIPRYQPGVPGKAYLRGKPSEAFDLTFVRVEPFVVPKKSLTGDNMERVDTRVLQVIYAVETRGRPLYVGQQLDVFLNVK